MKKYILKQVELVKKEFKDMDKDVLFNMVSILVCSSDEFDSLSDADKFNYLVDGIEEKTTRKRFSDMTVHEVITMLEDHIEDYNSAIFISDRFGQTKRKADLEIQRNAVNIALNEIKNVGNYYNNRAIGEN